MLSSRGIRTALDAGDIAIEPYDERRLQPASVDLTLHPFIRRPAAHIHAIDLKHGVPDGHTSLQQPGHFDTHTLRPGEAVLGCTEEVVRIGHQHVGRVEGKSSLARLFLAVHVTGGFIDPGFEGQITLEIVNLSPWSLMLFPGMSICQVAFEFLDSPPLATYETTGRYNGQRGPTESRYSG